jgi:hypothetical protein
VGPGCERAGGFLGDAALAKEHAQDRVAEEAFEGREVQVLGCAVERALAVLDVERTQRMNVRVGVHV